MLFALGTVVNSGPLPVSPLVSTAWQVGLGCLPMVGLGLGFEHPRVGALTRAGFLSLAYMAVFPMGVCYLTSTAMLLVPIVGIISAAILLGEAIGPREIVAMALTLGGVSLALRRA